MKNEKEIPDRISEDELDYLSFKLLKKTYGIIIGIVVGLGSLFTFLGISYITDLRTELTTARGELKKNISNYKEGIDSLNRITKTSRDLAVEYNNEARGYMKIILDDHIGYSGELINKVGDVNALKLQYNNLIDEGDRNIKTFEEFQKSYKELLTKFSTTLSDDLNQMRTQLDIQTTELNALSRRISEIEIENKVEFIYLSEVDRANFSAIAQVMLNYEGGNSPVQIKKLTITSIADRSVIKQWETFSKGEIGRFNTQKGAFEVSIDYLESQKRAPNLSAYAKDYVLIRILKVSDE